MGHNLTNVRRIWFNFSETIPTYCEIVVHNLGQSSEKGTELGGGPAVQFQ